MCTSFMQELPAVGAMLARYEVTSPRTHTLGTHLNLSYRKSSLRGHGPCPSARQGASLKRITLCTLPFRHAGFLFGLELPLRLTACAAKRLSVVFSLGAGHVRSPRSSISLRPAALRDTPRSLTEYGQSSLLMSVRRMLARCDTINVGGAVVRPNFALATLPPRHTPFRYPPTNPVCPKRADRSDCKSKPPPHWNVSTP